MTITQSCLGLVTIKCHSVEQSKLTCPNLSMIGQYPQLLSEYQGKSIRIWIWNNTNDNFFHIGISPQIKQVTAICTSAQHYVTRLPALLILCKLTKEFGFVTLWGDWELILMFGVFMSWWEVKSEKSNLETYMCI